ncbi:uncharacterized protein LOC5508594 isoform X2 [Nematostella vectensis]|nr:uncharacterized protein LOC5508594 isoform X1 [Nematostella vectensis]XP_048584847.1 uncharacterized protein LOC5508594 isoform X2 [Nematostella vectensis]
MADNEDESPCSPLNHPQIIFIRLGKDKSKDAIQNEVFKSVRRAFYGSTNSESDSKNDKNYLVLPDIESADIQDVALGQDYVGLLLNDGRVCRFKCSCSDVKGSVRVQPPSNEEPIFQVQSDEAFARRMQDQLNSAGNLQLSNSAPSDSRTFENLSAQGPSFRSFYPVGESSLLESVNFPTDSTNGLDTLLSSTSSTRVRGERENGTSQNRNQGAESVAETNTTTPLTGSTSTSNATSDSSSTWEEPRRENASNSSTQSQSATQGSSTLRNVHGRTLERLLAHRQSVRNYRRHSRGGELMAIPLPQWLESPTVVQRTIFSPNPYSRSLLVPSHVVIPAYSFDQQRLGSTFSSRSGSSLTPRFLTSRARGRRLDSLEFSSNSRPSSQSRDNIGGTIGSAIVDSDSEFKFPEVGNMEWLQTASGDPVLFSHIVALHSAFILVEKTHGTLYHWPYTSTPPNMIAMDTNDDSLGGSECKVPLAELFPMLEEVKLVGESVVLLAAHRIRCTLVTKTGKICTFYDKIIRECNNDQLPALLQQLSHPAFSYSELEGDEVTAVDCSDFFSAVMTKRGKVFWWGLLPSEERQDFKQKLNRTSSSACSISVNDKVQLRQHLPGFPGALVYKSSDTHGSQLARLLSHETEEGAAQTGMKIKVRKIPGSPDLPTLNMNSAIPINILRPEENQRGVASPRHVLLQEARSSSPHTSIRNRSSSSDPNSNNPDVEIWEVKDVTFLESENKVLGTVAAIDGPHVIVKVANAPPNNDSLRVFKLSELETVPDVVETSGALSVKSSSSIYRGCLNSTPKCILDAGRAMDPNEKQVLTGLKPISMATTAAGVSLLVQSLDNNKTYFLGPVNDNGSGDKIYTSSLDSSTLQGSDDASATVEGESVLSAEAALDSCTWEESHPAAGQKRKQPSESSEGADNLKPPFLFKNTLACSKFSYEHAQHPSLHTTTGSNVVFLCDRNGCLYPRPFGTKLSDPCATELPPLQCFGLTHRLGFVGSAVKEEQVLMVFVGFKELTLIPAIQSGIVSKAQGVLDMLEALNTNVMGQKGKKGPLENSAKRVAVENSEGQPEKSSEHLESSEYLELCTVVRQCINEHTSSNQNVLHVCVVNPAFMYTPHEDETNDDKQSTIGKLLAEYNKAKSDSNSSDKDVEVAVLSKLLTHPLFGSETVPKLKEQDAKGCTPFMLAIQCHNFKAALYILSFVEKNKGKCYGSCSVSLEDMIFSCTFNGMSPVHALATACTENMPPSGLGNSLTVSNLPSSYTPRMLLKLFQSRYPSAYRATIPPMIEEKKYPKAKTPRQRLLEKSQKEKELLNCKKPTVPKPGTLNAPSSSTSGLGSRLWAQTPSFSDNNRIPVIGSRREAIQGMVMFSDGKELRQALTEMNKHMVSSENVAPEGGLTSLIQHVLDVQLTEVSAQESDKVEMEVGIRGSVYNVSTSSGTTKISRKTQTSDSTEDTETANEDGLICQLFAYLLSYPQMAHVTNEVQETVLAFMINNTRWIKLSQAQGQRLVKYSSTMFGPGEPPNKGDGTSATRQPNSGEDITAEIKITGTSGSSSIESNLLAQLDEISSSFRNLVDTLASLEGRPAEDQEASAGNSTKEGTAQEGQASSSGDLIDLSEPGPSLPQSPGFSKDENLPVLIQLAKNWHCVATTVLGHDPNVSSDVDMNVPSSRPGPACDIDAFVYELLVNSKKAVLATFVETIIKEMNKYPEELKLASSSEGLDREGEGTASRVAIMVGTKFLRAVVRQMSVHLSRSGVSYVDLRSRLGVGSPSGMHSLEGSEQSNSVQFKSKVRMVLRAFSWLAVHVLVEASEATVLPVREGVAKAQARSTGASISNNVTSPNIFPGRYRGGRPGIRVSQYDSRSPSQESTLRTAYRRPSDPVSGPVRRCRGTRLAAIREDSSSPEKTRSPSPLNVPRYSRTQGRRGSTMDSDSESDDDDDDDGTMIRRAMEDDSDLDIEETEASRVSLATGGLNRDHPYAWALDGRLSGLGDQSSNNHSHITFPHYITNIITPPSVHTGNCYLTRMFSRLVKEAVDLVRVLSSCEEEKECIADEGFLPTLCMSQDECASIQHQVTVVLDASWVWLAKIMDVVEGQLHCGKDFDTKRYLSSLQRPEDSELAPLPRSGGSMPGASPEEYLMFLLRAHSNEHRDTLPVIDMLCYEHMVYVLDAFIYSINNWPRLDTSAQPPAQSPTPGLAREATEAGTSLHQHSRRLSRESEECVRFYGMDVIGQERDTFLNNLQATLQQKSRMLVPKATWEVFTHNVGLSRLKSVEDTSKQTGSDETSTLPVTPNTISSSVYPSPLALNWTTDETVERWKIAVDLFSRLFLADGPGAERDSFLAVRAGVAGRLARFRRTMVYLRESVTADNQQPGMGVSGLRVGTTLSISVKRSRLLADTLKILSEMQPFHYSNFRAKFEGEEGSGPGVNRGFFAAVANALKSDEKVPPDTAMLMHEPGKLPEQSGFYAPKPYATSSDIRADSQIKTRRLKMYTAIGRFIGLSLWFNNTVPLNFSRHVVKFLLSRDVTWEDLAFFNADLFEGLSRMMIDANHPLMTSETFQATYCCHFETSVGGTTEELVPGGSHLPVSPENIYQYVRLYASKVMIGCVEAELQSMRSGLYDVIPSELLTSLSPEDFQLLVSGGTTDIDMNKLRSVITFTNSNGCSKDILERFKRWFWSIVQKMTPLQRQQLLYFCTGSAVLPVMSDRRDPDQELNITVDVISGNTKALPMATTCGQRMSIPLYPSKRILKKKLLQAIQCQSYGLG